MPHGLKSKEWILLKRMDLAYTCRCLSLPVYVRQSRHDFDKKNALCIATSQNYNSLMISPGQSSFQVWFSSIFLTMAENRFSWKISCLDKKWWKVLVSLHDLLFSCL